MPPPFEQSPAPGNLRGWAIYWQTRAASLAADAREWRKRDATISNAYQETACAYYARARHLVQKLQEAAQDGVRPEGQSRD